LILQPRATEAVPATALRPARKMARALEPVSVFISRKTQRLGGNGFASLSRDCGLPCECASRLPNLQMPHLFLASAYAQSEQLEEARVEAAEVLRINPGFTIESLKPFFATCDRSGVLSSACQYATILLTVTGQDASCPRPRGLFPEASYQRFYFRRLPCRSPGDS
jgi:hypothetical protein